MDETETELDFVLTDIRAVIAADPTGAHVYRSDALALVVARLDEQDREIERLRTR